MKHFKAIMLPSENHIALILKFILGIWLRDRIPHTIACCFSILRMLEKIISA